MAEHPIQSMMKTTMESIKEMVDVNTIVGEPVETPDGTVIIPISRVTFGFAAGGGDCTPDSQGEVYPFGWWQRSWCQCQACRLFGLYAC